MPLLSLTGRAASPRAAVRRRPARGRRLLGGPSKVASPRPRRPAPLGNLMPLGHVPASRREQGEQNPNQRTTNERVPSGTTLIFRRRLPSEVPVREGQAPRRTDGWTRADRRRASLRPRPVQIVQAYGSASADAGPVVGSPGCLPLELDLDQTGIESIRRRLLAFQCHFTCRSSGFSEPKLGPVLPQIGRTTL